MQIINMSKTKLNSLEPLILPKNVTSTECELFKYPYYGKEKLLKKLHRTDGIIFANKLYTIEALNANKVLSDELNKTKSQCDINASSINSLSKKISDQSKKVDDILEQRNRKIYSTLNKSESKKQDTGVKNQVETLSDDTIENISRENIETLNRVYITVK